MWPTRTSALRRDGPVSIPHVSVELSRSVVHDWTHVRSPLSRPPGGSLRRPPSGHHVLRGRQPGHQAVTLAYDLDFKTELYGGTERTSALSTATSPQWPTPQWRDRARPRRRRPGTRPRRTGRAQNVTSQLVSRGGNAEPQCNDCPIGARNDDLAFTSKVVLFTLVIAHTEPNRQFRPCQLAGDLQLSTDPIRTVGVSDGGPRHARRATGGGWFHEHAPKGCYAAGRGRRLADRRSFPKSMPVQLHRARRRL